MDRKANYLDLLRCICCLMVVMTHSLNAVTYGNDFYSYLAVLFSLLARPGVGIFFMISGVLFLDESKNINYQYLRKKILKLIYLHIVFSMICGVINECILEKNDIIKVITRIIKDGEYYHLWYIEVAIGLYLLTPYYRLWIKEKNKKLIEYVIVLSLIFGYFLPTVQKILNTLSIDINCFAVDTQLQNFLGYGLYFILGWYLSVFDVGKQRIKLSCLIITFITIIIELIVYYYTNVKLFDYNNSLTNVIMCAGIFIYVKDIKNISMFFKKFAALTLGIYLIHPMIIKYIEIHFSNGFFVRFILTTIICIVVVWLIRKINIVKRILMI